MFQKYYLISSFGRSSQKYMVETFKSKVVQGLKQTSRNHTYSTKSGAQKTSISFKLLGLASGAGLIIGKQIFYQENHVYCEAKLKSRSVDEKETQHKFDWRRFWQLLKPHWWYLIIAVSVKIHFQLNL